MLEHSHNVLKIQHAKRFKLLVKWNYNSYVVEESVEDKTMTVQ